MTTYENDPGTKRGLILLGLCFMLLLGFFFWYNNRASRLVSNNPASNTSEGLLSVFSPAPRQPDAPADKAPDSDGDGLSNDAEKTAGTNPTKADTDADGLTDREEVLVYKTKPLVADTDADGMSDGAEIAARRDPLNNNPTAVWPPRPAKLTP